MSRIPGPVYPLTAALFFGLGICANRALEHNLHPLFVTGLLYSGAAITLSVLWLFSGGKHGMTRTHWMWVLLSLALGGLLGQIMLSFALHLGEAAPVSLLLNLEAVLTAIVAWTIFGEPFRWRSFCAVTLIVVGGALLALDTAQSGVGLFVAGLVVVACLGWAVESNLLRKASSANPIVLAAIKAWVVAGFTLTLGLGIGERLPLSPPVFQAVAIGAGMSGFGMIAYVLSLRHLGAARTAAYFGTTPFIGALAAVLILGETFTQTMLLTAILMIAGIVIKSAPWEAFRRKACGAG